MENLKELERQYYEARDMMDWQTMVDIMKLVYPDTKVTLQAMRKAKIKPLQEGCRISE